jgi:hypothetical protein
VTDVVRISRIDGTEGEGQVLPLWCDEQHLRSIVVVASKDHSRHVRRVLDRAMKDHPTHVTVQAARYSSFDPDRWWETRNGIRTEIIEFQKLLLDIVLHPMPGDARGGWLASLTIYPVTAVYAASAHPRTGSAGRMVVVQALHRRRCRRAAPGTGQGLCAVAPIGF